MLNFLKLKKTNSENCDFADLLSLFDQHNLKTIWCMQLLYIPNNCSATAHLPFLVWGSV